jgi:hypothetical protein
MLEKPLCSPPYGYMKSPGSKDFWIIDEEAAVVRQIFQLTVESKGLFQTACYLTENKVPVHAQYHAVRGVGKWTKRNLKDQYSWNIATAERILKNREYCGCVVNFKTSKRLKDKRSTYTDESEWMVFENVRAPIIDRETFENVQRAGKSVKRKRADRQGSLHPLADLLYCSECGGKMHIFCPEKHGRQPYAQCGNYRKTYTRTERRYNIHCPASRRIIVDNILDKAHCQSCQNG